MLSERKSSTTGIYQLRVFQDIFPSDRWDTAVSWEQKHNFSHETLSSSSSSSPVLATNKGSQRSLVWQIALGWGKGFWQQRIHAIALSGCDGSVWFRWIYICMYIYIYITLYTVYNHIHYMCMLPPIPMDQNIWSTWFGPYIPHSNCFFSKICDVNS